MECVPDLNNLPSTSYQFMVPWGTSMVMFVSSSILKMGQWWLERKYQMIHLWFLIVQLLVLVMLNDNVFFLFTVHVPLDRTMCRPQIGFLFKSVFHWSSIINDYSMIIHRAMLSKYCLYVWWQTLGGKLHVRKLIHWGCLVTTCWTMPFLVW